MRLAEHGAAEGEHRITPDDDPVERGILTREPFGNVARFELGQQQHVLVDRQRGAAPGLDLGNDGFFVDIGRPE